MTPHELAVARGRKGGLASAKAGGGGPRGSQDGLRSQARNKAYTYIITSDITPDHVCIGSTNDINKRLAVGRSSYKLPGIKLLLVLNGGHWETVLHDRFESAYVGREWFQLTPDLQAFIKEHQ